MRRPGTLLGCPQFSFLRGVIHEKRKPNFVSTVAYLVLTSLVLFAILALFKEPDREPSDKCKGDCVQVKTHQWHSYRFLQDAVTGQWVLTCYTLAQFHCKKPNDADAMKAPKDIDPES